MVRESMMAHLIGHVELTSTDLFHCTPTTTEAAEAIVTRVLSNVSYSQRCIEDRRINPHGEEAEDVFEVEEQLTPGCGPAIRY